MSLINHTGYKVPVSNLQKKDKPAIIASNTQYLSSILFPQPQALKEYLHLQFCFVCFSMESSFARTTGRSSTSRQRRSARKSTTATPYLMWVCCLPYNYFSFFFCFLPSARIRAIILMDGAMITYLPCKARFRFVRDGFAIIAKLAPAIFFISTWIKRYLFRKRNNKLGNIFRSWKILVRDCRNYYQHWHWLMDYSPPVFFSFSFARSVEKD